MKFVLLVRSLERGGAERQVVMLARGLRDAGHEVVVVVFYEGGVFERDLIESGIRLVSLEKAGRWDVVTFSVRLLAVMKAERPDVLYCFMTTPNVLSVALRPVLPSACRTVWGIRSARVKLGDDWLTRLHVVLEDRLSGMPDLIIVNSQAGARELARRGFPASKVALVRNGIDVDVYKRDAIGRQRVRHEWKVGEGDALIGIVARPDPIKAHDVFLKMAAVLSEKGTEAQFVCVGVSDEQAATRLRTMAKQLGLGGRVRVEGPRDVLTPVYSALDVLVMCSHSEGFPNVVAEAMACGVPCAVTDAGDAVEIVGHTGAHARPGDPDGLAEAVLEVLSRLRADATEVQTTTRGRIVERYSIPALARATLAAVESVGARDLAPTVC